MHRLANSAKAARLRLIGGTFNDRPIILPVSDVSKDAAPLSQLRNSHIVSLTGTVDSTASETWSYQAAYLPNSSASRFFTWKGCIQDSDSHEMLCITPGIERMANIHCGRLSKFEGANSRLVYMQLEHSQLVRLHWVIREFRRSHMGHSHHQHDHDPREASGEAGERVSRLGLAADICLSAGKGFAGYISGSTAVIADAAHSMSDVVLSGLALWIFKAARAPKDEKHPYGHGKFETLGSLGISSLLIVTGGGIAWHAFEVLQALLYATDGTSLSTIMQHAPNDVHSSLHRHSHGGHQHGFDKEHQAIALCATLISICVKEGLYWVTKRVGDACGSELLKANAWHHRTDAISSVIALLGVGGAVLGLPFLDPLAGIFVSGMIIRAGFQTGYQSLQELVDSAVPDSVLSPFKETVMKVKGVEGCHQLRGRRAGSLIHLDVHIEVDPWLSVSAAHMIGETARRKLRGEHPLLEDIFIHIEPADALSTSDLPNNNVPNNFMEKAKGIAKVKPDCSEHQEVEKAIRNLIETDFLQAMTFERARCHFLQGRVLVEVEVSMNPEILIRDAMQQAQSAERKILETFRKISAVDMQLRLSNPL